MGLKQRYRHGIVAFCRERGIVIPPSFYRHATSRYAVIDLTSEPARLVTMTWLNRESLAYFLSNQPESAHMRVLDFHDHREMTYEGETLSRGAPFQ